MLVSFTYLALFAFDVTATSIAEVGIHVQFPSELVPTSLFVISLYLFVRFSIDGISDMLFFDWWSENTKQSNEVLHSIRCARELRAIAMGGGEPNAMWLIKNQRPDAIEPTAFGANLINYWRSVHEKDVDAITQSVNGNKEWIIDSVNGLFPKIYLQFLQLRLRLWVVAAIFFFDFLLPVIIIALVLWVQFFEPQQMRYEHWIEPSVDRGMTGQPG